MKKFIFLCLCASFFSISILLPTFSQTIPVNGHPHPQTSKPVIILDPGHGGRDPGKVGASGTLEKEINLKITEYLKDMLKTQDMEVIMTRTSDKDLSKTSSDFKLSDMKERALLIQKKCPSLVVSIHQNSYSDPLVYGAQCFYYTDSTKSKELASKIQQQIIVSTNQTKIREIKSNNDYYLLKHSPFPTVIVECGFLSNPDEEQLLSTKEYQRKMAFAIHLGILQYLNESTASRFTRPLGFADMRQHKRAVANEQ